MDLKFIPLATIFILTTDGDLVSDSSTMSTYGMVRHTSKFMTASHEYEDSTKKC